jgi:hypothetical protein
MVIHISDNNKPTVLERIHPVLYKIKNSKKGLEVLWTKTYPDTSFSARFGDLVVQSGKIKAVFLYQKASDSLVIINAHYPLFIDIDLETGNLIDSVGYLGDYKADANEPNSRVYYFAPYDAKPVMKYDGNDLIVPVIQPINGKERQFLKNISRNGVINKVEETEHFFLNKPLLFTDKNNNNYQYLDYYNASGYEHHIEFYSNNESQWSDLLAFTKDNLDDFTTSKILEGKGIYNNDFRMFINYRDITRNYDKVFAGVYNNLGRIKVDTIMTNNIQFIRDFATVNDEGVYYLSGFNNSLYPLRSFQVEQYQNNQKKSLIWKKDSLNKTIYEVCPLKNDKAIALGMVYDPKKLIRSFYIAEIDFSLPNGIIEETENLKVDISPNPAGDYITITLKPSEGFEPSEGSAIFIYNSFGEMVISESIHPMTASHRMNIESLPKGIYFVKIGSETAKFVKM